MQKCRESSVHLYLMPISGLTAFYWGGFNWCMTTVLTTGPAARSSEGGWQKRSYFTPEGENLFLKLFPLFPVRAIFLDRALLRICATKRTSEIRPGIHPPRCPWPLSDKPSGPASTSPSINMFPF